MANTVNLLSYANTYGDWMVTTNQLIQENNNFSSGLYNKNLGTLYLNDPTLGLQVTSNSIVQGQFSVTGVGSSAYVQNDLRIDGKLILTNTAIGISTPGTIYANGPNNGIVVLNSANIGQTLYAANVVVGGQDLSTYIGLNSDSLRANDFATLMLADDHINQVNTYIRSNISTRVATSSISVQNLIDANNAIAYVKGITVGDSGFSVAGGITLDGTVVSNSKIVYPYSTTYRNPSIVVTRNSTYDAEIKWSDTNSYWTIQDVIVGGYNRIVTSDLVLNTLSSTSSTTAASSNAANTLHSYFRGVDNSQNTYASAAFAVANTASANTVYQQGVNNTQNTNINSVSSYTTSSFIQANSAASLAQAGFNVANVALTTGQSAFDAANNALDTWVRGQANAAYNIGQSSYNYANTLGTYSSIGFDRANTSANVFLGTSGSATPNSGVISYTSDNGLTVVGSSNVLNISTSQDLRTTATPNFNNLTLTNALSIGQGGTGATSSGAALTNLLPAGATAGYVLATSGPGSYFWSPGGSGGGGSSIVGTSVLSSRLQYTSNGNGSAYTTPTYLPGSNQLRVYFDGVRQFDGYSETSNTIVSFTQKPANTVQILLEVDGYSITPSNFANVSAFTANTTIGLGANTVQLAIDALIANVAFKGNTILTGTPIAPTAANTTANTMIATTQYVQNVLSSGNTFAHNISGNANTVNNGVYITGAYVNPSWIVSIANTKILGNVVSSQITSVANTQITGNIISSQIQPTGVTAGTFGNTTTHVTFTVDAQGRISSVANATPNIANSQIFGLITGPQLANTGVTSGTYGGSTQHAVYVVDAQGRIIGAANATPNIANSQIFGVITGSQLAVTSVLVGTYGGTTKHSVFTVDQQGRITSAANVDPSIANTQITGLITNAQIASIDGTKVTGTISASSIANTGIVGVIRAAQLENTAVTPGIYGGAAVASRFTVDQQGRITSAGNVAINIANTAITGNIIASQIQPTTVTAGTYGTTTLHSTFTVDQQGRITAASSVTPNIANTQIFGTITDAQLVGISATKITGSITSGQITSIANTQITGLITAAQVASLATTQLTGTLTAAQLGTTTNPQFNGIGIGTAADTGTRSLIVAQNGYVRVGNTYISSGGDYCHISTNSWYNGTTWNAASAIPHILYQMSANVATWYRGTANTTPTYAAAMRIDTGSGDLLVTGNVTGYGTISDIRMKENIIKLDGAMDKISAINGYYFNYKSDETKARLIGVIAQEVEQVMPELVYEFNQIDSDQMTKAVRYEHLTAVLVEAVKELKQQIKDLKQEVDALKGNNK